MREDSRTRAAEKADLIGLSGLITPSLDEMVHVAREMERQGFTLPLLIGGATTSRAHTAVKIAPHYSQPVVHVLDASRAVPVTTSLLSDEGKPAFVAQHRCRLRGDSPVARRAEAEAGAARNGAREADADCLARRGHCRVRRSPACACWTTSRCATLREFIDWTPFFHTWELRGVYPRILEHEKCGPQARQVFADANALLDTIVEQNLITAQGRLRLLPGQRGGRRRRGVW